MTEAGSQVATAYPGQLPSNAGHVGAPLNVARVTCDDGVLSIGGPLVRRVFRTSDRGHIDDGVVHVSGRVDDTIISGGKNIDPREIERTLAGHPRVSQVVVVSVEDAQWGQRPFAIAACENTERGTTTANGTAHDRSTLEGELRAHCKRHLSSFKTPDRVLIVDEIPRTALGKPAVAQLRALALGALRSDASQPNEVSS